MPERGFSRRTRAIRLSCALVVFATGFGTASGWAQTRGGPPSGTFQSWEIVESPNVGTGNNELYDVGVLAAGDVWAVGRYSTSSGYRTLAMHWDGSSWSVVPTPNVGSSFNQLFSVAALASQDVWAVGAASDDNLVYETMIQHWDGSTWSVVPSPLTVGTSAYLYGITALTANDIWAVGYVNIATVAQQTLVEHWDGTEWTVVPSPNPSANRDILWTVSAVSATDVWAVGNSYDGSQYSTLIEHWNGTEWSAVPSANGPSINFLWGLEAFSSTDVWALGRTYTGSEYPALIERWDGTTWNLVSHPDENFYNELYDATALATDDVWAVGRHGGGFSNNLVLVTHWNGTDWSVEQVPLPSESTENFLYSVEAVAPDDIWAVGAYLSGFTYETLILQYAPRPTSTTSQPWETTITSLPNPIRAEGRLRFTLAAPSSVRLDLFDAKGRRVARLLDRARMEAAPHDVVLSARNMKPGLYFVRLQDDFQTRSHKLVVTR